MLNMAHQFSGERKANQYFVACVFVLAISTFFVLTNVTAQSLANNWSTPVNLSQSGAGSDPAMVVDSDGIVHVLWRDDYADVVYTKWDGSAWSEPVAIAAPFTEYTPRLFADGLGNLHAFWVEVSDEEYTLKYSKITSTGVANGVWGAAITLAESALDYDVAVDVNGRLHLSYVRILDSEEFPSGIYYRVSSVGGEGWSSSQNLYQSLYFRALQGGEAHVDIDTSIVNENQQIYIAWDNRLRSRVFMAKSEDGGDTWGEPLEVDKPDPETGASSPTNLLVYAHENNVLLLWRVTHQETGCTNYYQWSSDGGDNWQTRQEMFEGLLGCPDNIQILERDNNPLLFISAVQTYLVTWDGAKWSEPQLQSQLAGFLDPETQQTVDYECLQASFVNNSSLYVVGCDTNAGSDIWWLQRQIEDVTNWFPEDPVWSSLTSVTEGNAIIFDPSVVSGGDNLLHVFWAQVEGINTDLQNTSIRYARWEGERQWSQPVTIMTSPDGDTRQPAVGMSPNGLIYLVWSEGNSGAIKFSSVSSSRAAFPEDYSEAVNIPVSQTLGSSPDILVDGQDRIYVAYAVPINQGRGIYLTQSTDNGMTWSDPVKVFDAEAEGWAVVDSPKLALSKEGNLHLLWTRNSLPSGTGPLALFYAQSVDGGASWSAAEEVVNKPTAWSEIVANENGIVHRMWQENSTSGVTIWHDLSLDEGQTWQRSSPVSIFGDIASTISLTPDRAHRLHLLQAVNRGDGNYSLQHWLWDSESWRSEQSLDYSLNQTSRLTALTTGISQVGELTVLFASSSLDPEDATQYVNLYFTRRSLSLPSVIEVERPTPTLIPTETLTPVPSSTPEPTVTPTTQSLAELGPVSGRGLLSSSWGGLLIGGILVVFIVVIAGGVGFWFLRDSRR